MQLFKFKDSLDLSNHYSTIPYKTYKRELAENPNPIYIPKKHKK